jgi:hypothetical protein
MERRDGETLANFGQPSFRAENLDRLIRVYLRSSVANGSRSSSDAGKLRKLPQMNADKHR